MNNIVCWTCKNNISESSKRGTLTILKCLDCKTWFKYENDLLHSFHVKLNVNSIPYSIEGRYKDPSSFSIMEVIEEEEKYEGDAIFRFDEKLKLDYCPEFNADNFRTEIERYLNNICFK